MRYVDCFVSKRISLFMPVVGPCQYSITPDHTHPGYLIIYTFDDLCKTVIEGKLLTSKKGNISVISPDIVHHEIADDSFSRYIAIMIDKSFFNKICHNYKITGFKPFKGEKFEPPSLLTVLMRKFIMEAESRMSGYQELLEAIELRICHALIRTIFNIQSSVVKISSRLEIEEVIQFMNCHYHENISTEDMAAVMHRSPSVFIRLFKQETGASPGDFLIQIRLERARKLLIASSQSIADIAFACGFNSSSHFATSFL